MKQPGWIVLSVLVAFAPGCASAPDETSDDSVVSYTLGFDANGGEGELPDVAEHEVGATVPLPDEGTLSREGFDLAGWADTSDGPAQYEPGGLYQMGAGSATLWAVWVEEAEYDIPTVDVEGGSFAMGSTDGFFDALPVRTVQVAGFAMTTHEITFESYDAFADETGRTSPDDEGWGRDDRPVINVSWYDAVGFANWLSEKMELTPAYSMRSGEVVWDRTAVGWRLPTEAEWEFAARGGRFSAENPFAGSADPNEVAWYGANADAKTHGVGEKAPNELGIYDMSGNAREWCWDRYDPGYYADAPTSNPTGPEEGALRVVRGGAWNVVADYVRVDARSWADPVVAESTYGNTGFRLVRSQNP